MGAWMQPLFGVKCPKMEKKPYFSPDFLEVSHN